MKQNDIAMIILIGGISAIASFFISTKLFVTSSNRHQQVEVVSAVNPQFTQPSTTYFNSSSINPTQQSQIGTSNNQNPFGGQ